MVEQLLLEHAKAFVTSASQLSGAELYLRLAVDLAQRVNGVKDLSGKQKLELVVQTVLNMLDDAEKAEIKRVEESTEKEKTKELEVVKAKWDALRSLVKNQLPLTLALVIEASRGKFDLKKTSSLALQLARVVQPFCCSAGAVTVIDQISKVAGIESEQPPSQKPDENVEPPKGLETPEVQPTLLESPPESEPAKQS